MRDKQKSTTKKGAQHEVKEPAGSYVPNGGSASQMGFFATAYPESVKINSTLKDVPVEVKVLTKAIGITDKTYRAYMARNQELPPVQSEWILKYKELQEFGMDFFQSDTLFNKWMDRPSPRLHAKPKELLYNVKGIQQIIDELTRITDGYPA